MVGEDEESEGGDGDGRDFDAGRSLEDLRRRGRQGLHGFRFGFSGRRSFSNFLIMDFRT